MIKVTKTFLPPQKEYNKLLKSSWDDRWMTNRGPLVVALEKKLRDYLGVTNLIAMANGTLPLQIAIKALSLKGEIITTPFSYVATTSAIVWEGCKPIFVDIDPNYLTIDETKIEAAITEKTVAILATHVYGNPCAVEEIEVIAKKHNLKVIYDAAHCFAVQYNGKSLFNYGDISTCSFHATKLFHTAEGGAIFCNDKFLHNTLFNHHNFGHDGPTDFVSLGINAKMSECHAAMGLAVFPYLSYIIRERKRVVNTYDNQLSFKTFRKPKLRNGTDWNYAYYPIVYDSEQKLLETKDKLELDNIYPRRYFYPSLEELPYVNSNYCNIAKDISSKILCLPMYTDLEEVDLFRIANLINS